MAGPNPPYSTSATDCQTCYYPAPMSATLQRERWNGEPAYLGDLFRVTRMRGEKPLAAVCKLWTHHLGWEVRLEINADLQRSEVFRAQDDVLAAGETWKAALLEEWVAVKIVQGSILEYSTGQRPHSIAGCESSW